MHSGYFQCFFHANQLFRYFSIALFAAMTLFHILISFNNCSLSSIYAAYSTIFNICRLFNHLQYMPLIQPSSIYAAYSTIFNICRLFNNLQSMPLIQQSSIYAAYSTIFNLCRLFNNLQYMPLIQQSSCRRTCACRSGIRMCPAL